MPDRLGRLALTALVAAVTLWAVLLALVMPTTGDIAWSLSVADQVSAGATLYRDILDINPPLIFWFAGLARGIANAAELTPERLYLALVLALAAASAVTTIRLLPAGRQRTVLAFMLPLVLVVLAGRDLGQRDHLIALAFIPLFALERPLPRGAAITFGVAVGLAVCLKPFYLPLWLAVAALQWRAGHRDIHLAVVTTGVVYLASVVLIAPEFLATVRTYGSLYGDFHHHPWTELVVRPRTLLAIAVGLVGVTVPGARPLALGTLGAAFAFLAQQKGWPYHAYPMLAFGVLTLGSVAAAARRPVGRVLPLVLALALIPASSWMPLLTPRVRIPWAGWAARASLQSVQPGDSVLVLGTAVPDGALWVRDRKAVFVGSVPSAWWVRALYDSTRNTPLRAMDAMPAAERQAYSMLLADLAAAPELVAIERPFISGIRVRPGFGLVDYVRADPLGADLLGAFGIPDTTKFFLLYRRPSREGP